MEIITYDSLLEKNGGIGFEKQISLSQVVGDKDWMVDMDTQSLAFGEDISMDMQLLGSYSYHTGTWLWVWANEAAGYSQEIMKSAKQLQAMGEKYNIEFLSKDEYQIEPTDVHALGIIASGELGASAYYAGDYGDGIALMLVNSPQVDNIDFEEQARILSTFPQLISTLEMNHKRALIAYLSAKGYGYSENKDQIIASKRGKEIIATFDKLNRLINLNGNIIK